MIDLDIRYAFLLFPLLYVLIPFILSGTVTVLGGVTMVTFLFAIATFLIVTNLNIGGNAGVATANTGLRLSLNNEGSYSLFVVVFGGIFYLGAQLIILIKPLLDLMITFVDIILGFISWMTGIDLSSINSNGFALLGNNFTLNTVYPLGINVIGISVFGVLDAIMGSMFILGLYFMIASRGR